MFRLVMAVVIETWTKLCETELFYKKETIVFDFFFYFGKMPE